MESKGFNNQIDCKCLSFYLVFISSKILVLTIFKLYLDQKEKLHEQDFCYFESVNFNDYEIFSFFDSLVRNKNIQKVRAKWLGFLDCFKKRFLLIFFFLGFWRENCQQKSIKILRKLTRRPYFLTSNIEIVANNWFFISKGHQSEFQAVL